MREDTVESKQINDWLKLQPKIPPEFITGPMFRLVWSDDLYELRRGTFCLYDGELLIREIEGVENVRKYPWINERWILEQWYPPSLTNHQDLVESDKGSYEYLYVFESAEGIELALDIRAVQFLVNRILNKPKASGMLIRTTITDDIEEKERLQLDFDEQYLDVSTDIQSNLHFGEGIIVPSNYPGVSPNLRNK